ncbi:murein L,D-transpeptidase [Streptomyces sp. AJS327]|nr:murein L,D-transpeptidase [Streptomyces sp. AJS327]
MVTAAACVTVVAVVGGTTGCESEELGGSPVRVSTMPEEPPTSDPPTPAARETSRPPEPKPASEPPPPPPKPDPEDRVLMRTGSEGRQVRELQARLRQIKLFERNPTGYYGRITADAVRELQRQRGDDRTGSVTAATWSSLRDRTDAPSRTEMYPPTSRPLDDPDPRCLTGRVLCVSKESRTLAWMVDGEVRAAMDVRFGSAYTPTREGEFKVDFKSRDHHSTLYDTPMPYALFFSRGQAIHYSADFAAAGYSGASHGCVNVRDRKAIATVFDAARKGDKVIVYK